MTSNLMGLDWAEDESDECTTPVSEEITIVVAYLCRRGQEQFITIRTTESGDQMISSRPGDLKFAIKTAFALMGRKVLSVQMTMETGVPIHGREPTQLRIV